MKKTADKSRRTSKDASVGFKKTKTFEPDPKDANTVNAIRAKLGQIKEYKRILAEDGLMPDEFDKELESELIKQLIRIEKGLPPKKAPKPKKKKISKSEKPTL